ncbi:MipA/OmpV family protein [Raoultella terrigena]|uniref:MipA/OmpV family protein n=1 Tax=Raoultella terrigena TaxID=577 RepID=UPI001F523566|nr:MipA/OmpV family protein [Raoultella terrigena]MCI1034744.1 MipA/OmpV family protein [Raoultella terrigena]
MMKIKILSNRNIIFMLALISLVNVSNAQEMANNIKETSVTIGFGAISVARYSGADEQSVFFAPLFHIQHDSFFLDSVNGVGVHWENDDGFYFEPSLGYSLGRADKKSSWRQGSDKLKGLGNIAPSLNTSIALGWAIASWFVLEGKATLPISDSQGVSYAATINLIPFVDESNSVTVHASSLFGDARYMNTLYGINNTQSTRSGYDRYNTTAGYYGLNSGVVWSHQFSEHWGGRFSIDYTWLDNHAANSPIVKRRGGTTSSFVASYTF